MGLISSCCLRNKLKHSHMTRLNEMKRMVTEENDSQIKQKNLNSVELQDLKRFKSEDNLGAQNNNNDLGSIYDSTKGEELRRFTSDEKLDNTILLSLSSNYLSNSNKRGHIGIVSIENNSFIIVILQVISRLSFFRDFLNIMSKASLVKSPFLKNLIYVMNKLSSGLSCNEEVNTVITSLSLAELINPLMVFKNLLERIHSDLYNNELILGNYSLSNEETSQKSLADLKDKFRVEFDIEIKSKFFTGYLNIITKNCKNIKCGYKDIHIKSETFPFIELTLKDETNPSLQKEIELLYSDKNLEGECEKCQKSSNKAITVNRIVINLPKYLFIKVYNCIGNIDLNLLKRLPFRYFNKNYELISIIQSKENDDGSVYFCTIKIDYKWICFKDDDVSLSVSDEIFSKEIVLVFQMK